MLSGISARRGICFAAVGDSWAVARAVKRTNDSREGRMGYLKFPEIVSNLAFSIKSAPEVSPF